MAERLTRERAHVLAKDKALSRSRGKGAGVVVPVVNRSKCEGKRDCVVRRKRQVAPTGRSGSRPRRRRASGSRRPHSARPIRQRRHGLSIERGGRAHGDVVCPWDVFEVRRIDDADFAALSFIGRLKSRAHGRLTAYTPRAADCHGCGLCVAACPEKAITLASARGASNEREPGRPDEGRADKETSG